MLGKPDLGIACMQGRVPNNWQRIVGARLSEILDMEKAKARVSAIQAIKREPEVGLLDTTKEGTRIQPYPPKQEDVFFDAADVFLEKVVARFRESTLRVCFPLAIGFTIWYIERSP